MHFYKDKTRLLLFIFLSLAILACKEVEPPTPPDPPSPPIVSEPVEPSLPTDSAMMAVNFSSQGYYTDYMTLSDGSSWGFGIYVPKDIENKPVSLIIGLHGGNAGYDSYMQCLGLPGLQNSGGIVFAPFGGLWWADLHTERMLEFIKLAKIHWPIDSNKIAVTGYSNGGTGSVFFAKEYPELFSAAIPMASDYGDAVCPGIPTYLIHGQDDSFYSANDLKGKVDGLVAQGCDIQLKTIAGYGHGDACKMVFDLHAGISWVKKEVWKE